MLKAYGTNEPIGALPRVLQVSLPLLGVQEIAGTKSNKTIIAWRDEINQAVGVNPLATAVTGYSNDDIPWCGLFEGYVNLKAGKQMVEGPLWARNWAKFGVPVAVRSKGVLRFEPGMEACLGDTVVLQREGGGGHVFKYICENKTHIWGIFICKNEKIITLSIHNIGIDIKSVYNLHEVSSFLKVFDVQFITVSSISSRNDKVSLLFRNACT